MPARRAFRDRDETEVAVLDTLVDRGTGLTVFELRARVDADIDTLEAALSSLKDDELITSAHEEGELVIKPADRVVPDPSGDDEAEPSLLDELRRRLPF